MVAFFASPLGDDVEKIGHFQRTKIRSHSYMFFVAPPNKILIVKANVLVWKYSKRLFDIVKHFRTERTATRKSEGTIWRKFVNG